jgi:glycosyltransferase involved in cell wall biosynthesis
VVLSPGLAPTRGWLECLQHTAYAGDPRIGIVGARVLDRDRRIAHAGLYREGDEFVSYYEGEPASFGPADVRQAVLAVGADCMYVKQEVAEQIGWPQVASVADAVGYCRRAWEAGYVVVYEPAAILQTTGTLTPPGDFADVLQRGNAFFAPRPVCSTDGRLKIVYVTESTGRWGGHRVVFDDINSLAARGHDVALFTLDTGPGWMELAAPVTTFASYAELEHALGQLNAIKVSTWWRTAAPVWRASVLRGIPVYFVQDIESSYFPDSEAGRHHVLASYRREFRYLTTSSWNRDRLAELGLESEVIAPAIDLGTFHPLDRPRRDDMILAIARSDRLKRFDLTVAAWRALPEPRPELCLFGDDPTLAPPGARHVLSPTDAEVNELLNQCAVFVQTSAHEGFGLPALEAMAAGAPVVCTDAHGNRDYCVDGVNCLMPTPTANDIARAIEVLLEDVGLRGRLGAAAAQTARRYDGRRRVAELEPYLIRVTDAQRP